MAPSVGAPAKPLHVVLEAPLPSAPASSIHEFKAADDRAVLSSATIASSLPGKDSDSSEEETDEDMPHLFEKVAKTKTVAAVPMIVNSLGVWVKASTLGPGFEKYMMSLEAS